MASKALIAQESHCSSLRRRAGYTLFELLIALAVISAAIAIAPAFFSLSNSAIEGKAFSQSIVSEIRLARSAAIRENRQIALEIDSSSGRFGLAGAREAVAIPDNYSIALEQPHPNPSSPQRVVFYPDGSSSGGKIHIISARRTWIIDIGLNGRISISDKRA